MQGSIGFLHVLPSLLHNGWSRAYPHVSLHSPIACAHTHTGTIIGGIPGIPYRHTRRQGRLAPSAPVQSQANLNTSGTGVWWVEHVADGSPTRCPLQYPRTVCRGRARYLSTLPHLPLSCVCLFFGSDALRGITHSRRLCEVWPGANPHSFTLCHSFKCSQERPFLDNHTNTVLSEVPQHLASTGPSFYSTAALLTRLRRQ